jgi:tRNA (cmo5U34)-methyltransferase
MSEAAKHFADPQAVANYAEGPPRNVPGFLALQRMTTLLLAERVPEDANILVVGAGGGLELRAFADAHPGWTFDGVDPSAAMLSLATEAMGPHAERARLHQGYIDQAPEGPFDAATCLLTMHFVEPEERLRMAAEIHRRLKPGRPLVVAHFSFPQGEGERARWLSRFAAFLVDSGVEPDKAEATRAGIGSRLPILSPEEDETILRKAGFTQIELFYVGFTFRGWVAYA